MLPYVYLLIEISLGYVVLFKHKQKDSHMRHYLHKFFSKYFWLDFEMETFQ